ncbi:MAG: very short patch repair endonuclease [Phascolarctobacterium sp.]|nr:very short patch repair endonuclease [Candidatus Phascolarctobacterium caballi]
MRYRKNYKVCGYQVDIAIAKYKVAVFCDGAFWHGKDGDGSQVRTNTKFWENKIQRNKERDLECTIILRDNGWLVIRFWDDEIFLSICVMKVFEMLKVYRGFESEKKIKSV